jgi:tetratricopeptide (TPR) repeat protein
MDDPSTKVLRAGKPSAGGGDAAAAGETSSRAVEAEDPRQAASTLEGRLCPGATVSRYVVLSEIGAGGMGVVYAAWDPELDRKVALKLLHPERLGEDEERLRREAQAMARLSHPNVVVVHDVGTYLSNVFVAMEFVEGQHLGAWLAEKPRPWKEVVDVFRRAGMGLASAHGAGLVHRDFKPQNVLVGRDGSIRVADFGLARSAGSVVRGAVPAVPSPGSLLPQLTMDGMVAGTPEYMAPEQLLGEDPDPRSDQFSFCVALFLALFGDIPYRREFPTEPYLPGAVPKVPTASAVPKWVRRAVLKGLALDPAERWPDMPALLEELGRDPSRRRAAWAIAAVVVVVAAGTWLLRRPAAATMCRGAAERLAGAWDAGRRDALEAAFARSGAGRAGEQLRRSVVLLDGYAESWAKQRTEACEATHVRGEQSGELLDLRMACLDRRRDELSALVSLLATADPEIVARAPDAVLALEPLSTCADTQLLLSPRAVPRDPATLARLVALETRLAAVKAAVDAGREASTRGEAERVVLGARELGFAPFEAEASYALADLVERVGEFDAAAEEAFRCWAAAERGDHEEYRVRALSLLVWIDGNDRSRLGDAERWAGLGEASLSRLGAGGVLGADLHNAVGAALQSAGRAESALAHHGKALEFRVRAFGEESYEVAKSRNNIGTALFTQARFEEALDSFQGAVAILEKVLGVHPATALCLSNIGSALIELRRPGPAREAHGRALSMRQELFGPESLWVGITEVNLALADLIDRPRDALGHVERAEALLNSNLPADHPSQAFPHSIRGRYLLETGRAAAAVEPLGKALRIWGKEAGHQPYALAGARFLLARALWPRDPARALSLASEARSALRGLATRNTPLELEICAWLAERGK